MSHPNIVPSIDYAARRLRDAGMSACITGKRPPASYDYPADVNARGRSFLADTDDEYGCWATRAWEDGEDIILTVEHQVWTATFALGGGVRTGAAEVRETIIILTDWLRAVVHGDLWDELVPDGVIVL